MPFSIVRDNLVNMRTDAIVNTANPMPEIGFGVDSAIHKKAGIELIKAREEIGALSPGTCAITKGFLLDAKYVIHTVGPIWNGGHSNEEKTLAACYKNALNLAKENKLYSIAFPLISSGNYRFPKGTALKIAIEEIKAFLLENEMDIYLVVWGKEEFELSTTLEHGVKSYIDENYIEEHYKSELKSFTDKFIFEDKLLNASACSYLANDADDSSDDEDADFFCESDNAFAPLITEGSLFYEAEVVKGAAPLPDIDYILSNELDMGFSETLLMLIDKTGEKDSYIYSKANVDRKLFSKIRSNPNYKPSKATALAFAFALELNLDETKELIAKAGYALSHSSKFDVIIEYFLISRNYDIFELNQVLFKYDQPLLGA